MTWLAYTSPRSRSRSRSLAVLSLAGLAAMTVSTAPARAAAVTPVPCTATAGSDLQNAINAMVTDSVISDNSSYRTGGGAYYFRGTLSLTGVTVTRNRSARGGGVILSGTTAASATLDITGSTVKNNTAANTPTFPASYGGGIAVDRGTATIAATSIRDNTNTGTPTVAVASTGHPRVSSP